MIVRIDKTRQDPLVGKVDDLGAGGNGHVRAYGDNAAAIGRRIALDEDGLVCERRARFGVDQVAGLDGPDLHLGRGRQGGEEGQKQEYHSTHDDPPVRWDRECIRHAANDKRSAPDARALTADSSKRMGAEP